MWGSNWVAQKAERRDVTMVASWVVCLTVLMAAWTAQWMAAMWENLLVAQRVE